MMSGPTSAAIARPSSPSLANASSKPSSLKSASRTLRTAGSSSTMRTVGLLVIAMRMLPYPSIRIAGPRDFRRPCSRRGPASDLWQHEARLRLILPCPIGIRRPTDFVGLEEEYLDEPFLGVET